MMRIFEEEQRFRQSWLIILLAVSIMIPIMLILKEYSGKNTNMSTLEFTLTLLVMFGVTIPIFFFTLRTRVDEKGIHYKFFPFHAKFRTVLWSEIKSASVRKYNPISEYGGWGLKGGFSRKKGKAVNVSGDIGIQLELTNGKRLLIGTQKENDAKSVLENYQYKIKNEHK